MIWWLLFLMGWGVTWLGELLFFLKLMCFFVYRLTLGSWVETTYRSRLFPQFTLGQHDLAELAANKKIRLMCWTCTLDSRAVVYFHVFKPLLWVQSSLTGGSKINLWGSHWYQFNYEMTRGLGSRNARLMSTNGRTIILLQCFHRKKKCGDVMWNKHLGSFFFLGPLAWWEKDTPNQ